jgi:hypothetical protein
MARFKTGDTKLIWIDRLAIVLAVAVSALIFWVGWVDPVSNGPDPVAFWAQAILQVVGVPWLLIRALIWALRPRYY